jgi:hypothetical protein
MLADDGGVESVVFGKCGVSPLRRRQALLHTLH